MTFKYSRDRKKWKTISEQLMHMSELLTAVIQYNKCYYDIYYNYNNLHYQLHALNFL